jgi:hypothetical protein
MIKSLLDDGGKAMTQQRVASIRARSMLELPEERPK